MGENRPEVTDDKPRGMRVLPLVLTLGALVLAIIVASVQFANLTARHEPPTSPAASQRADVGGPFSLIDHTGTRVTEADFAGRPMLVYFGFTYCPDICPLSLQKAAIAMDIVGPAANVIQPVLISLDPERDTPEAMARYVASNGFPAGLTGLTGTPEDIASAASAYKVYYARADAEESASDYLIDHSSILYLMDEAGALVDVFGNSDTPQDIALGLAEHLGVPETAMGAGTG